MALQATKQGIRPPSSPAAATADPDPDQQPLALDGTGCAKRSAVEGLPDDAFVEVLSRLPAKSLCRSKCVSKAWCDLIADRLRCRKLPLTLEGFFYGCVGSDSWYDSCSDERVSDIDEECSEDDDWEEWGEDDGEDDDGEEGSEDSDEGGSEDDSGCGCLECKTKSHHAHGHFINLSGRSVPLVDPLFSFLRKQHGIRNLLLIDSCNGLLLFGHTWDSDFFYITRYVVYNPATEHWVLVPSSGFTSCITLGDDDSDDDDRPAGVSTYLVFDPVASLHFELIEFWRNSKVPVMHTYSSETKIWVTRKIERWEEGGGWNFCRSIMPMKGTTFFNKMLHFVVSPSSIGQDLIAAMDGTGKIRKVIRWIENRGFPVFIGQSKGLLHCLSLTGPPDGKSCHMTGLSIWVLKDYDADEWDLKHTVSISKLFGKETCQLDSDYNIVTIHPDRNVIFFLQHWDKKLVSYDLDRKEVCVLCPIKCHSGIIQPYVPYFSEVPVLSKR